MVLRDAEMFLDSCELKGLSVKTVGSDQSREWRQFRDWIITRDNGCDLGCRDHPSTKEDVLRYSEKLLDPENVICVSAATHKAIHYGTGQGAEMPDGERKPGDTCLWRKA